MRTTKSATASPLSSDSESTPGDLLTVDDLRECGIYETPNGKKLIASRFRRTTAEGSRISSRLGSNSNYFFFSQYHWAFHGDPDFEVSSGGELYSRELVLAWTVDQLIDTGTTAGSH